jgi:predicted Ser/Thr protein kinase
MLMDRIRVEQLEFIGAGKHGEVYRIDERHCIKIYNSRQYLRKELAALERGAEAPFFPRVYDWGRDYIIREYAPGTPLNRYLRVNAFTPDIARQLVEMVETMRRLRFRRADTRLSHIIIDPKGKLWLIDPVNTMKKSPPFPRKLLKGLMRRGVDGEFLEYVKTHHSETYARWQKHLGSLRDQES